MRNGSNSCEWCPAAFWCIVLSLVTQLGSEPYSAMRRYIPFSGGPRKCVGDQFALMEAVIALAVLLKRFEFSMVPDQDIGMTTGATIHTQNGLYMTVKERQQRGTNGQVTEALESAAVAA